ncbi:p21-Rho-binding domain protein, partial [Ostertagia ostertagi]
MWMVVSEDTFGRVHFSYRDLPGPPRRIPASTSAMVSTPQRYSRGCLRFPNPGLLSPRHSPLYSTTKYEDERYDNVTPEPQWQVGVEFRYGDHSHRSSGSTSSSDYQAPSRLLSSSIGRHSSLGKGFYYYSQYDPASRTDGFARPIEHGGYYHVSPVPVSCGKYVVSCVPTSSETDRDGTYSTRTPPLEKTAPRRVSKGKRVSYAVSRESPGTSNGVKSGGSVVIIPTPDYASSDCASSDNSQRQFDTKWRDNSTAAARNPLAPTLNTPFVLSSSSGSAHSTPVPLSGGVTPVGTMVHAEKVSTTGTTGGFFSRKDKKKKDKRPRIRKEDISNPTNFQHKAHVGWDQDNGFSNNMCDSEPMDESIQNIIRAAGQDPTSMSRKTIKFVYDFIENYKDDN